MFPAGFEPAVPASQLQQTYALDPAATGIGNTKLYERQFERTELSVRFV